MSEVEKCENCKFYKNGNCRKTHPIHITEDGWGEFPAVMETEWCGEWEAIK